MTYEKEATFKVAEDVKIQLVQVGDESSVSVATWSLCQDSRVQVYCRYDASDIQGDKSLLYIGEFVYNAALSTWYFKGIGVFDNALLHRPLPIMRRLPLFLKHMTARLDG